MNETDPTVDSVRSLEGDELIELCRHVALENNRLQSLMVAVSNQMWLATEGYEGQDTLAKQHGCRSTVELIQRLTGEPARVVAARIRLGREVSARNSLLGEELVPMQEHVASALESGNLNLDSAMHISKVITKNSRVAHPDDLDMAERCLVQAATGMDYQTGDAPGMALDADYIRRLTLQWDAALDPDGVAPDEAVRLRKRFLNIGPTRDGLARITGLVKAEVAAAIGAIADTLNNPRVNADVPDVPDVPEVSDVPDASGTVGGSVAVGVSDAACGADVAEDLDSSATSADPTDHRTPGQKRHDALETAVDVALASRELPMLQGTSATILVEVKEEHLKGGGPAWLIGHDGAPTPISMGAVHGMSCAASIQAVARDSLGRITGLGSPQRIFTPHQRRAIALRDGGCVIPGCSVPAAWCEVHHVKPHSHGGPTHTDNGALLCRNHHATIDTSGWKVTMHEGIPLVRPPGWLTRLLPDDPRRRWVNQVLADQARRIESKLAERKRTGGPPGRAA